MPETVRQVLGLYYQVFGLLFMSALVVMLGIAVRILIREKEWMMVFMANLFLWLIALPGAIALAMFMFGPK